MQNERLVFGMLVVCFFVGPALSQTWLPPENVTNNVGIFDQQPSLKIGPAPVLSGEAVHIAYNRVDKKEIYYAVKEFAGQPPTWAISQATNRNKSGAPNSENWHASLGVLSTGRVYIAYRGDVVTSDKEIFIVNNVNGAFDFLPVFVTMNTVDDSLPALFTTATAPYVAYVGPGGTDQSNQDDEVWFDDFQAKSQITVNGSNTDVDPDLAIDANGKAHVVYAAIGGSGSAGDKEIWYAENTTGSWNITQITINGFEDAKPCIRLETNGVVHIAWQGLTESFWDIYYTNNGATAFPNSNIRVTASSTNETEPSLVVDPNGKAHIAYQVGSFPNEQIYYTHNMSGTFTSQSGNQELASNSNSTNNVFPSMDIDANNHLHLAYQGLDSNDNETEIYYTITGGSVPVELTSLSASYENRAVILRWSTATETNNFGFEVQKANIGEMFHKIGFVRGAGTTVRPRFYSYTDNDLAEGRIHYRLKQMDFDGAATFSKKVTVEISRVPDSFELLQNFPNPFNPGTRITYRLKGRTKVSVDIYNLRGELVTTLVDDVQNAGVHDVVWDGKDSSGNSTPTGIYVARMRTPRAAVTLKMLKLR